jgi:hypothetical protein
VGFIKEIANGSTRISAWSSNEVAGSFDGLFNCSKGDFTLAWKITRPATIGAVISIKGSGNVWQIINFINDNLCIVKNRLDMAAVVARITNADMIVPRCFLETFISGDSLNFKPGAFRTLDPDVIEFTAEHNVNIKAWINHVGKIVVTISYALRRLAENYYIHVRGGADLDGLIALSKMEGIRK